MSARNTAEGVDAFIALQQILASSERISDLVHEISSDEAMQRRIDTEVETIAQSCIQISEAIGATTMKR